MSKGPLNGEMGRFFKRAQVRRELDYGVAQKARSPHS